MSIFFIYGITFEYYKLSQKRFGSEWATKADSIVCVYLTKSYCLSISYLKKKQTLFTFSIDILVIAQFNSGIDFSSKEALEFSIVHHGSVSISVH